MLGDDRRVGLELAPPPALGILVRHQPVAAALEGAAGGREQVRGGVNGHQVGTAPATPAGRVAIPAA